ncbi:hypothetical protein WJX72_000239 [[Myrmecia] bisecta]|uniref:DUF1682-domain-containing protein n=1 Tax=[Myrmecia] bisecta TaxID=41462 RepID=A0AAW1R3W9_9CHLO
MAPARRTQEGAVLERNFSLLGPDEESGPEILTRESGSEYQLYASGRRYCQAMVFTLDLKKRQDLFSLAYYILNPRLDALFVEVFMNETSMPPIVLAIAPPKVAKELAKDNADIVKFARKIEINRERCPSWPADKLAVYAEHSSVFYELMPEPLLEQVFNRATWDTVGRYFKYLHFTSEAHLNGSREAAPADKDAAKKAAEPPRNVLKFALALPPQDRMEDLGRLMNMMMTFIDVVGTFKLSPEQQKRADRVRQEYEESKWKEAEKQRMEAIQEKKAQRKAEEKERVKNMSAEAYQKWEERQQRIQTKRAIKARTKKL